MVEEFNHNKVNHFNEQSPFNAKVYMLKDKLVASSKPD